MLRAILNKSWRQHPTRHQLYGHLPPITKTIQVRRTRHAGHCWRSRDELIRDVLLWTPTHGRAKAGRPSRTYIQQLCEDTGCCPEDLPRAMNDREEWRERVRDIRATSPTWWWWFYKKNCPDIYSFHEISAVEFVFENLSCSFEVPFSYFFLSSLLDPIFFEYSRVFVVIFFSPRALMLSWFGTSITSVVFLLPFFFISIKHFSIPISIPIF